MRVRVAVDTPQHSALASVLDYESEQPLPPGTLVRVPLGRRTLTGIVWTDRPGDTSAPDGTLRPVTEVLDALPPMTDLWRALVAFAATYYQRSLGEVALASLPGGLRKLDAAGLSKRVTRLTKPSSAGAEPPGKPPVLPQATADQDAVWSELHPQLSAAGVGALVPLLLHGVTGSGKTEIYLRAAADRLDAGGQVLMMVPEINLTPQLEERVRARFPGRCVVSLHSGLTPAQRLSGWLLSALGRADLVLGTRLAIFAPLPRLALIVVDEEHDPSYKQQEGARYSARDLAVYRAHAAGVPVLLGSATPSLETWQRAQQGRYRRLSMPQRVGQGALPQVRLVDMGALPRSAHDDPRAPPVLAPALIDAMADRLARGEQSLLLLNRRGYAPVLHCTACSWKSACPHCSAWRVFHKSDRSLRCHHCGLAEPVPRACPDCGNLDIQPIGRGTEKLEEQVSTLWPQARVARIDADTTRGAGALQAQLAGVHAGEVDILVGTQMLTKGHDFRRVTLVAAVNPDGALFAADFRAPERLFALLMQAAGRAGRDAAVAGRSEMWLQTWHPQHALYAALRRHDFDAFAESLLREREGAGLPPFSHLALLRAEAREAATATAFLQAARDGAGSLAEDGQVLPSILLYAPVPATMARVAAVDRMQMLVESGSRAALQRFLAQWLPQLHRLQKTHRRVLRWAVDVDPLSI